MGNWFSRRTPTELFFFSAWCRVYRVILDMDVTNSVNDEGPSIAVGVRAPPPPPLPRAPSARAIPPKCQPMPPVPLASRVHLSPIYLFRISSITCSEARAERETVLESHRRIVVHTCKDHNTQHTPSMTSTTSTTRTKAHTHYRMGRLNLITSSAPPPMDINRRSLWNRDTRTSFVNPIPPQYL